MARAEYATHTQCGDLPITQDNLRTAELVEFGNDGFERCLAKLQAFGLPHPNTGYVRLASDPLRIPIREMASFASREHHR